MDEPRFAARCGRCGNGLFETPDHLALEADMICELCGQQGKLVEFSDLATLDWILRMQGGLREVLH